MIRISSVMPVAAVLVAACAFMAPVHAGGFDTNLVANGDAESGPGFPNDTKSTSVPDWTISGALSVIQYGASGGFPDNTSPGPTDRGKNFFYGGPGAPRSTAVQSISVSSEKAAIATGVVSFTLSGYLGGYSSQTDNTVLIADFKSSTGSVLKHVVLGPVTNTDRKGQTGLLQCSAIGLVPKGASSVVIKLVMTRYMGGDNDGSADNVSLVLHKKS